MRSTFAIALLQTALLFHTSTADAFCGFYVEGSGATLRNRASSVILMRDGTRTVLTMQNNYEGPTQNFALVVPVPSVLQRTNVRVVRRDVFDHVDQMAAPRLVEYWEQDPCGGGYYGHRRPRAAMRSASGGIESEGGSRAAPAVRVEARFDVGEYDIVILSATDSAALETWLRTERYQIPAGASLALAPYVRAGMKFFVARVNASRVRFQGTRAVLSPLRVHYDSESFTLPVRLGMINSPGRQELVIHILADNHRYNVANRPNVGIPTNLELNDSARDHFAEFYNALFDRVLENRPNAVVTEYAWQASSCDPCPGPVLDASDLYTLGAEVLPRFARARQRDEAWSSLDDFVLTRLHLRYGSELTEDLVFREVGAIEGGREDFDSGGNRNTSAERSDVNNFQGRYIIRHPWTGPIRCNDPQRGMWGPPPRGLANARHVTPAQDLAFAARGNATTLTTYLRTPLPRILRPATPPTTPPPARTTSLPTTTQRVGRAAMFGMLLVVARMLLSRKKTRTGS